MTIRNLHRVLDPGSVAVVGASDRPGSPGAVAFANLIAGGYAGTVWPVNPRHATVAGRPAYRDVASLPGTPDLALVATPPRAAPDVVAALAGRGTPAAVVLGRGRAFDPGLKQLLLAAARPGLLRVIGPGTAGVMSPRVGLNAGLAPTPAAAGRLALVSQSGAIAATLVDWAATRGIGFSHVASLGEMADVDVADYLDLLAGDRHTAAILLFFETLSGARKFLSAARAAARLKPVVAIKAGRHEAGARAAALHTGALAGADAVADAALRRAGVLRVTGLAEMFEAAEIMGRFRPLAGGRLGIVTNAGGAGVLAVDRLVDAGGAPASLAEATVAALDREMPTGWSRANPADIDGDAPPERYLAALAALAADKGVDALLAMHCPTGLSDGAAVAAAVAEAARDGRIGGKPVLSCFLGGAGARQARAVLRAAGIASYENPAAAAAAIGHLSGWGRAQAALLRVPDRGDASREAATAARERVAAVLAAAADEGRRVLNEVEANAVLAAYGVPVVETRAARDAAAAEAAAAELLASAGTVAVKLLSPDVVHKAEVGGVVLDLGDAASAGEAARGIAERVAALRPGARIDGFVVQPMVRHAFAEEVIAGIGRDAVFGPVILFGTGGVKVEAIGDTAVALPPLDGALAGELIERTRIGRMIPAAAAGGAALRRVLVALSDLSEDFPCIRGVDVNPLLAGAGGVCALDASIEIEPGEIGRTGPNPDFAIRPYPAAWTREVELGGTRYELRAIRPTDAFLYPAFLERLDPEAIRMRFLAPRRHFPDDMGLRLSQLDYDRDMAFVAIDGEGALAGVARMASEPERRSAEYALIVRSDLGGRGLGSTLLRHLADYARAEGFERLEGAILRENRAMIGLVSRLGFTVRPDPQDPGLVASRLELGGGHGDVA